MVVMTKNLDMLSVNATRTATTTSSTVYEHQYVVPTRGRRLACGERQRPYGMTRARARVEAAGAREQERLLCW